MRKLSLLLAALLLSPQIFLFAAYRRAAGPVDHLYGDSTAEEAKLPVRAPAHSHAEPSPETLMLTVTSSFQLALNSKPLALDELLPKLTWLMERRQPDARTIFIKAPGLLQYDSVVLLIDLAKGAGVVTVGLVADET